MRTQSTITTSITFSHRIRQTVCPHPRVRMLHRPRVASSSYTSRVDALFPTRCERCGAFERDSRRFAPRSYYARRPPARRPSRSRPRLGSHRSSAVPTARWIRGDADGRRRRDDVDACRRGRDSKIRRLARVSKRGIGRRDARARRRATEEGSRARGARGRARDDEGRRGALK